MKTQLRKPARDRASYTDQYKQEFISSEMRYCTFVSNIFRKATLPFSTASTIAPSRTDSRGSAQSTGDPIMAAVKKCLSAIRPPERTFTDGAVSVFLSASSHDTSPYNAREHIHRPPGKRDKIGPFFGACLCSCPNADVTPRTISTSSFCSAASANDDSMWSAPPHHILGSTNARTLQDTKHPLLDSES